MFVCCAQENMNLMYFGRPHTAYSYKHNYKKTDAHMFLSPSNWSYNYMYLSCNCGAIAKESSQCTYVASQAPPRRIQQGTKSWGAAWERGYMYAGVVSMHGKQFSWRFVSWFLPLQCNNNIIFWDKNHSMNVSRIMLQ